MYKFEFLSAGDEAERSETKKVDIPIADNTELRTQLITRIENLTLNIIQQICSNRSPNVTCSSSNNTLDTQTIEGTDTLEYSQNVNNSKDDFGNPSSIIDELEQLKERRVNKQVVNFATGKGKNKLALMMTVVSTAHRLLITNMTITRRSFYYELKGGKTANLVSDQRQVDEMVNRVANLLNCAPWELNLMATSKGLVAGDLTLSLQNNGIIDCNVPGGALIPQIVSTVTSVRTRATFVLVVEKDAVFQKLLEDNCTSFFKCIMITGKGYPDVATRMLVKLLSEKMGLPVYALVDADPFGVDIMCVYRFGSAALSKENKSLACSNVRWLGIHPSELIGLGVKTIPLTECDLSRLAAIENRTYVDEGFLKELRIMRNGKAEIEAIFSKRFLISTYLSCKIQGNDYI